MMGYQVDGRQAKVMMNDTVISQRSYSILDIEVDNDCGAHSVLSNTVCASSHNMQSHIPLYRYEDIPQFLRGNPFIKKGYRALLPASQCFSSLFIWSNESINIWSHLIGFAIFFMSMFADNITISSNRLRSNHFTDHLFITLGLLCYQGCMLLSAGFHLFFCHSEKACRRWLAMDLAGISIGIFGCYLPAVHLAFYCHQVWRDFYMVIVFALAMVTLALQVHPRYLSPSWSTYRMMLYSSLAAYGIIPSIHWVYLSGGLQADVVQLFYGKIINIYLLGLLALVFYTTKFPERLFPGKVDYIGSSHQWWHVIVVVAFLYWHNAGEIILQYRVDVPCRY